MQLGVCRWAVCRFRTGFRPNNARVKVLALKNILFLSTNAPMSDWIGSFVAMQSDNVDVGELAARMTAIGHLPGMIAGRPS